MAELLLELLSEEIPARMQAKAADDLKRLVKDRLEKEDLEFSEIETYSSPRRLTLFVDGLPTSRPANKEEKRGPRSDAPDQALTGFAKANRVSKGDLEIKSTEKGEFYFAVVETPERITSEFVPLIVEEIFFNLSWPKSMRWGNSAAIWVRPVHEILVIFDGKLVQEAIHLGRWDKVPGLSGGRPPMDGERVIKFVSETTGHRFLAPKKFKVRNFKDYKAKLLKAKVMLDAAERAAVIEAEAGKLAKKAKLKLKDDPGLLEEVAGLVEWPVVKMGSIDKAFMDLPPEVLTTVMRHHQKYFALVDGKGKLAPKFIVVANTETKDRGKAVVAGNERVLKARLADAKFFWDQDRKRTLESRLDKLNERVFHDKLGSVHDKVLRIEELAAELAEHCGANSGDARWAARLAKADLSTEMVAEFPELQGTMGRYYALADGEKPEVADAIADHYSPLGPNDACPTKPVSISVALADKIDTLVGFWAIGETPTGSKDPFALRRAGLGVIRLIIENSLRLSLRSVLGRSYQVFGERFSQVSDIELDAEWRDWETPDVDEVGEIESVWHNLYAFFADRLKVHLRGKGVRYDHIDAVFALGGEDDLVRLLARVEALGAFLDTDAGSNLLTAYKRAANILRIEEKRDNRKYDYKDWVSIPDSNEDAEDVFYYKLMDLGPQIREAIKGEKFTESMQLLASIKTDVDRFFNEVTINVDDEELRERRLKILSFVRSSLDDVADFSKIEGGER